MKRQCGFAFVAVSLVLVQGCSMNVFGPDRPPAGRDAASAPNGGPDSGADGARSAGANEQGLGAFDSDHDGQLTKAELESGLLDKFHKTDTNGDGVLSATEIRVLNDQLLSQPGGSPVIDWNADGRIDMAEFASQWRTNFDRSDVNTDGILDPRELAGRAHPRKPRELPPPELGKYRGRN